MENPSMWRRLFTLRVQQEMNARMHRAIRDGATVVVNRYGTTRVDYTPIVGSYNYAVNAIPIVIVD